MWIKDLKVKPNTLNLTEEKLGIAPEHNGTGDNFVNRTPITQALEEQ